ncbi:MAG TPA: hypothetical protein VGY75_04030 [Candidatus Udaeobacter sp.]|jgi:hypothetical protein|nr:hypothetical protein [Candidatus Udaeobacter sp.]
MTKKRRFHPGEVWWEALCDFRNELHEHIEGAKKDQRRFQNGRLFKSLVKRIKAEATGKDEWVALFACYQFVTDTSRCDRFFLHYPERTELTFDFSSAPLTKQQVRDVAKLVNERKLGYDQARRLHGEEMAARELSSPRSFCSSLAKEFAKTPEHSLNQLNFRVRSIASWIEAQESFSQWLVFKELHSAWRGNRDERAHAIQACYLSQLPQRLLAKTQHRGREVIGAYLPPELHVGTNYDNKPWNAGQWASILKQAAGLTEKTYDCTELEKLVWWCYPVFRRYKWNTREVLNVASEREIDFEKEKAGIDKLIRFQKYWIRRGLRFTGGKQKQNRTPPLAEFVRRVVLPDSEKMWGSLGGFLFPPKKN